MQVERNNVSEGVASVIIMTSSLVIMRVMYMGSTPPHFAPADNPASDCADVITRLRTFLFLPALNVWLLLFPRTLSFDWSMEAVPLVESNDDVRNACSLLLYASLVAMTSKLCEHLNQPRSRAPASHVTPASPSPTCYANTNMNNSNGRLLTSQFSFENTTPVTSSRRHRSTSWRHRTDSMADDDDDVSSVASSVVTSLDAWHLLIMALAVFVLPFLPATNLFFYVGFVVAERVLYIPSMGFALLVACGAHLLQQRLRHRSAHLLLTGAILVVIAAFSVRTVLRNVDWLTEENLYRSGVAVNPAKGEVLAQSRVTATLKSTSSCRTETVTNVWLRGSQN